MKIAKFLSHDQLLVVNQNTTGEEGNFFVSKLNEIAQVIETMPVTYDTQEVEDPTVWLHYFYGGCDWYITERDREDEQHQAFGLASMPGGWPELGYISIVELVANRVELDLYWTPTALSVVQATLQKRAA